MSLLAQLSAAAVSLAAAVPTPGPELPFNPDDVTPGPIGFFVFFAVAVATGLLVMDLVRRSSRVQAREDIRQRLEAEVAAAAESPTEPTAAGQPTASAHPAHEDTLPAHEDTLAAEQRDAGTKPKA